MWRKGSPETPALYNFQILPESQSSNWDPDFQTSSIYTTYLKAKHHEQQVVAYFSGKKKKSTVNCTWDKRRIYRVAPNEARASQRQSLGYARQERGCAARQPVRGQLAGCSSSCLAVIVCGRWVHPSESQLLSRCISASGCCAQKLSSASFDLTTLCFKILNIQARKQCEIHMHTSMTFLKTMKTISLKERLGIAVSNIYIPS